VGDDLVAHREPGDDLRLSRPAAANLYGSPLGFAPLAHQHHVMINTLLKQGGLGDDQGVPRIAKQFHLHQNARFQGPVRVRNQGAHLYGAGHWIDPAVDAADLPLEGAASIRSRLCLDAEARLQVGEKNAGHGEIQLHHAVVVQRRDQVPGLYQGAGADVP